MEVINIISSLEKKEEIHLGRLLILISVFSEKRKGKTEIEGLTKMAKLDFLLRYPVYLSKALKAKNKSSKNIQIKDYEKESVESKMVRFKYGPWDFRYRRFVNMLIGKGLVYYTQENRTINIGITSKGSFFVKQINESESFYDITRRAKIIRTHFDNKGSFLMKFIYATFPEIGTLKLGSTINNNNEN
jgi:hypothetical protein